MIVVYYWNQLNFSWSVFIVFLYSAVLTQKKDAYLENEFILCHCQYVKNICWSKSNTRLQQNYLLINFMVLGTYYLECFSQNKLMSLISQKNTVHEIVNENLVIFMYHLQDRRGALRYTTNQRDSFLYHVVQINQLYGI